jgi:hypothetical protein
VATTYYLRDTNSGLATPTGARFYKELLTATGAAGSVTSGAIAGGLTVVGYAFTDVGVPGAVGSVAGEYRIEMNVTTSSTTANLQSMVAQVSSTGTEKNTTSFSTAQPASAGLHTFFHTTAAWTWATGDRMRVTYRFVRTSTMGNETVTISANTVDAEVVAPWTIIPSFTGTLGVTQAANTLAASGTATANGVSGTLVVTQADNTVAAAGILRYSGTLAVTQAGQTLSAAGVLRYTGTLSVAQAADTLVARGAQLQFVRPVSDRLAGGWTTETGATTNLFQSVDEAAASFADYIRSENNPASSPVVLRLGALSQPVGTVADSDVQLRVQYDKEGAATAALVVQLRQGYVSEGAPGTLIASTSDSDVTDAAEDLILSLTAVEHAAISYTGGVASDLDVRITANLP